MMPEWDSDRDRLLIPTLMAEKGVKPSFAALKNCLVSLMHILKTGTKFVIITMKSTMMTCSAERPRLCRLFLLLRHATNTSEGQKATNCSGCCTACLTCGTRLSALRNRTDNQPWAKCTPVCVCVC